MVFNGTGDGVGLYKGSFSLQQWHTSVKGGIRAAIFIQHLDKIKSIIKSAFRLAGQSCLHSTHADFITVVTVSKKNVIMEVIRST